MNIRFAILAAADHIEANPGEFDYDISQIVTPEPPWGPPRGCALAWTGHFAGIVASNCYDYTSAVCEALGLRPEAHHADPGGYRDIFYAFSNRMFALCGNANWTRNPTLCARTLRAYADRWHPASPSLDPAYVSWRDALKRENGYARSGADG